MGTSLAPVIGYDRAAELVKEAYRSGRTVREVAMERSGLPAEELEGLLNPVTQAGE
jgi:fumarate hydratase class II